MSVHPVGWPHAGAAVPARRSGASAAAPAAPAVPRLKALPVAFRVLLALYLASSVTKAHDLVPALSGLQPAKVLGGLLLLSALFVLKRAQVGAVLKTRTWKWIGLTALLMLLSVPTALWKGYSVEFLTGEYWKTLAVSVVACAAWADRAALRMSLIGVVIAGSAVAAKIVAGAAALGARGRASAGVAFDSNETALLFLVLTPLAVSLAQQKGRFRIVWYLCALVMVAAIVKTGSRGGFLGLMALTAWMIVRANPRARIRQLVVVAAGAVVFALSANERTFLRIKSIFNPSLDYNYSAEEGRIEVWKRGLGYMVTHPLLGVGVRNFPIAEGVLSGKVNEGFGIKYSAAHNSFVEIGAELGVFGLVAFIGMLWATWHGAHRAQRAALRAKHLPRATVEAEAAMTAAAMASLVALVVGGSFLSFAYHPVTYFIVAFGVGVGMHALAPDPARAAAGRASSPRRRR